jgi:restriction system protein
LVLGGALANAPYKAILLFTGDTPAVAEAFAQSDPYVTNGLVKRWYVREWTRVDAVAFDPDPIRGGKIVIQAKRYTNPVGVSAVCDLCGTVHNEGANKGILVTTSDFVPDAYAFAKDRPLTLLSGGEPLYLLSQHGHSAKMIWGTRNA